MKNNPAGKILVRFVEALAESDPAPRESDFKVAGVQSLRPWTRRR